MNIEVKNTHKPIDYTDSMKILEKRVKDVFRKEKGELLWILEHKRYIQLAPVLKKKTY